MSHVADTVLTIIGELTGRPATLQDDLYDLGFDSLLIVQAAARIRERLAADPPLAAYFDAATPADLVLAVEAARTP